MCSENSHKVAADREHTFLAASCEMSEVRVRVRCCRVRRLSLGLRFSKCKG